MGRKLCLNQIMKGANMYQVGEHVLYGLHGVCKIEAIEGKKFDDEIHDYYILKPVFDHGSTIFVSTKKEALVAKMIPILSAEDILNLIDTLTDSECFWIENEAERKGQFKLIIEGADRNKQLGILKAYLLHKMKLISMKRKMHTGDEMLLKNVEKRIFEEFAFVLNKSKDELATDLYQKIGYLL